MSEHHPSASTADLRRILHGLTTVLVTVAVGCLAFTATTVTEFAIRHDVDQHIAWMLDPLLGIALGTVLVTDGMLSEYRVRPGGWASVLRWFAGIATWLLNCWDSIWPAGTPFGAPRHLDPAGLALHSVLPALLVILAEAITRYRREIITRLREVETEKAPAPAPVVREPAPAPAPTPPAPAPVVPRPSLPTICGGRRVYTPVVPQAARREPEFEQTTTASARLDADAAHAAIEAGWREGLTIRECAPRATRSASFVHRVYQRLETEFGPQPSAGQLALAGASR